MDRALRDNAVRIRTLHSLGRKRARLRLARVQQRRSGFHVAGVRWNNAWRVVNQQMLRVAKRLIADSWLFPRNTAIVRGYFPWMRGGQRPNRFVSGYIPSRRIPMDAQVYGMYWGF